MHQKTKIKKKSFCLIGTRVFLAIVFFAGCAKTAENAAQSASVTRNAAGNNGDLGTQAPNQQDPKVEEARQRCEAEIKKSELQPDDALSKIQVRACIFALTPVIAACGDKTKMEVVIKIIIEKTGVVSNAFAVGDTADSKEAKCVAEAVKTVIFPKVKSNNQQVLKYPFTLGE